MRILRSMLAPRRANLTLPEMLLAMTLLLVLFSLVAPFLRSELHTLLQAEPARSADGAHGTVPR